MIDWKRVSNLREEVGAEDFEEVIALFMEEVEEVIERLSQGANTGLLEEDLHFLKGSAMNLGFDHFSQLCQTGELMASAGQETEVNLTEILDSFAASKNQFMGTLPKAFAA